jgi:osmotically-inducible protein OsmY
MANNDYYNQSQQYDQHWFDNSFNEYKDYDNRRQFGRQDRDRQDRMRNVSGNRDYNQGGDQYRGSGARGGNNLWGDQRYGGGYAQRRQFEDTGHTEDRYNTNRQWPEDESYTGRQDQGAWGVSNNRNYNEGRRSNDRPRDNEMDERRNSGHSSGDYVQQARHMWEQAKDKVSSWFGNDDNERSRYENRPMGPHRGKGPKGYQRSDQRIREDVSDRFYEDDYLDASDLQIRVENGEVILDGTVDSKQAKRRAEDIAEAISGVRNVQNHIRVNTNSPSVGGSSVRDFRDTNNDQQNQSRI